jgi:hypothetical protein
LTDLAIIIPDLSDPQIQNENNKALESSSAIYLSKQIIAQSEKPLLFPNHTFKMPLVTRFLKCQLNDWQHSNSKSSNSMGN